MDKALEFLQPLKNLAAKEAAVLYELCWRALVAGASQRLSIFGLERPDIVQNLDVTNSFQVIDHVPEESGHLASLCIHAAKWRTPPIIGRHNWNRQLFCGEDRSWLLCLTPR